MIVNDLDLLSPAFAPTKAHPPLIIDSNAELPSSITLERFQPIARWNTQVVQHSGDLQLPQLATRCTGEIRKPSDSIASGQGLRV
jgi:hypothetical protein